MIFWIFIVVLILLLIYLYIQNYVHTVTNYDVHISNMHPELIGKKLVFLSDTHFRERPAHDFLDKILIEVEEINPDLILFGGDLVHSITGDQVLENVKDFFFQLGKVAPTYVVYGNHDLESNRLDELAGILRRVDVTLLRDEAEWIYFDDNPTAGFWLMGLSESWNSLQMKNVPLSKINLPDNHEAAPRILLAHFPQFFEKYLNDKQKRPNLTLSGDAHGGQVILPVIGGIYAPGQGFNPYYDFGMFTSEKHPDSRLILTRGIGNSSFPFRVNNRPEVVVIEFK